MSFTHQTKVQHDGKELDIKITYDYMPAKHKSWWQVHPAVFDIIKIEAKHDDEWQNLPHLLHELDHYALKEDIKAGLRAR